MISHKDSPHTGQEKEKKSSDWRIVIWAFIALTLIPNLILLHTHYLEYQSLLVPEQIERIIVKYEESDWLFEEDPAHLAELSGLLPRTKWVGVGLAILEEPYSIQYNTWIIYEKGRAGLDLSSDALYLTLPTPGAFRLKIENPELHEYILKTYYSEYEP